MPTFDLHAGHFMPGTVDIQRPWGTYSLGPGKPLEKDGLHNNSAGYGEHQNTPGTAGPPVGSLTPPVSGSSRGPDGKGMQLPHQRPAVHCGYCEWRLGEEVGRGGGDGDGGPGSWSESGSESRLCLLLAVGPSAGHFSAFEPHLLSLQNEHISNTHCADLPSGARDEMCQCFARGGNQVFSAWWLFSFANPKDGQRGGVPKSSWVSGEENPWRAPRPHTSKEKTMDPPKTP